MILTGNEIKIQRETGAIVIEDFDEARLGPNSYNLRLAPELLLYDEIVLDPRRDNRVRRAVIPPEGIRLLPGRVYLARTMEYTETRGLVPMLEGRSSIGRLGLQVHVTAGFGDIGFCGNWTLELTCTQPVMVYPGMEICQIYYLRPAGHIAAEYHGKYQGERGVTPSRLFWEAEEHDHRGSGPAGGGAADDLREVRPGERSPRTGAEDGASVPVVREAGDQPPEAVLRPGVPDRRPEPAAEGGPDPARQTEEQRILSGLAACVQGACGSCYWNDDTLSCSVGLLEDTASLLRRLMRDRDRDRVRLQDLAMCLESNGTCIGCGYEYRPDLCGEVQRLIRDLTGG